MLIILTMQVYLDETMEHFDLSGKVDLQGSSALTSVNHQFQQNHDHLWILASGICPVRQRQPVIKTVHRLCFFSLADFSKPVWQPPKSA
jgi:hypothetical protein